MAGTSVVLVHGGTCSPEMWVDVVAGLEARGVPGVAADLPTHQRANGTFADDVAHVRDLAAREDRTVLCGHSYGGAVITEAAASLDNVVHLVYLTASMLDRGETVAEWALKRPTADPLGADVRDDGTVMPTKWGEDWYDGRLLERFVAYPPRPMASAAATEPLTAAAWHEIPSTYVVATRDSVQHPETQREFAARATHVVEMDSDHAIIWERPDEIADLLASIAKA